MQDDIIKLTDIYAEQGYAFAEVNPKMKKSDNTQTVDITLAVTKGDLVKFNRVEVQGDTPSVLGTTSSAAIFRWRKVVPITLRRCVTLLRSSSGLAFLRMSPSLRSRLWKKIRWTSLWR